MTKKNLFTAVLLAFVTVGFLACGNQSKEDDGKVVIKGTVKTVSDEGMIGLEKMGENGWEVVTEVKPDASGSFNMEVEINKPDFYRLNFFGKQRNLVILNQQDIEVEADGTGPEGLFKVDGSEEMSQLQKYDSLSKAFSAQVLELNKSYNDARVEGDQSKLDSIQGAYKNMEQAYNEGLKSKLLSEKPTLAIFQITTNIPVDAGLSFHQEMLSKFQKEFGDNKYLAEYANMVENESKLAIGAEAPEIALPNPEGDTIRLSDLRGKVVMIDFWAAWCKPCRMENPNVVKMYQKYKDKGFDVLGVSLDRSKDAWVNAIEADHLFWNQVSDLQYFSSVAARTYNVQGIPFTVLVDEEGKIIAKNLRGQALDQKLGEVLN